MRFDFTDEQQEIRDTARKLAAERFKPEKVRAVAESGSYDDAQWKEISELGWAGIAIPEEHGGQGLGMVELAILCEQLGYVCAPTPFLSNACAGLFIDAAGSDEQKAEWLPGIASGEARAAVAVEPPNADGAALVPDAEGASVLILPGGPARLVKPAEAELERLDLIDQTRGYWRASADGGDALGDDGAGPERCAVAVAAELVGLGQRALDMAVGYAKERHQFDRPIGAYQAVSHMCAQMLFDIEEARSLTYGAAWAADAEPEELPLAAAMAKARAADAAWSVTKASIQVHGGIGFTWEHDLHFLLKRARVDGRFFGTAGQHRNRIAELAGLA